MNEVLWYTARGGGFVAFALLTASVSLGLVMGLRMTSARFPRWVTNDLHRYVAILGLAFTGVHVATLLLDTEAGIGPAAVVVPFASAHAPLGVAMGVLALDLILAVMVTTALRRRIGYARWRAVHLLSHGAFALALMHGVLAGSSTGDRGATLVYLLALTLVGPLAVARLLGGEPRRAGRTPEDLSAA